MTARIPRIIPCRTVSNVIRHCILDAPHYTIIASQQTKWDHYNQNDTTAAASMLVLPRGRFSFFLVLGICKFPLAEKGSAAGRQESPLVKREPKSTCNPSDRERESSGLRSELRSKSMLCYLSAPPPAPRSQHQKKREALLGRVKKKKQTDHHAAAKPTHVFRKVL